MMKRILHTVVMLLATSCVLILPGIRACDPATSFGFPTVVMEYKPATSEVDEVTRISHAVPAVWRFQSKAAWVLNGICGLILLVLFFKIFPFQKKSCSLTEILPGTFALAYLCFVNIFGWVMFIGFRWGVDFDKGAVGAIMGLVSPLYLWPLLLTCALFNNGLYKIYVDIPWETQPWFGRFFYHHDDIVLRLTFPLTLVTLAGLGWLVGKGIERWRRRKTTLST